MNNNVWKTDDKAWMKQRRAEWKIIQIKLTCFAYKKKDINKFLKPYFMTGVISAEEYQERFWDSLDTKRPFRYLDAPVLLACWLCPDQSDENWKSIKKNYNEGAGNSGTSFLMSAGAMAKNPHVFKIHEDDFYGGLEERLYRILCPTRCRREYYPIYKSDELFIRRVGDIIVDITEQLKDYLCSQVPDGNYILLYRFDELKDALQIAPQAFIKANTYNDKYKNLSTLQIVLIILSHPEGYPESIVLTAKKVKNILDDPAMPAELQHFVNKVAESMPTDAEFQIIAGSTAHHYIEYDSSEIRDTTLRCLYAGERECNFDDDYQNKLYSTLWPLDLQAVGDKGVYAKFSWPANSTWEILCFRDALDMVNCRGFYGYFETSHKPAPAFYKIEKEGKLTLLYQSGGDSELDQKIASFEEPGKAIMAVVEYLVS